MGWYRVKRSVDPYVLLWGEGAGPKQDVFVEKGSRFQIANVEIFQNIFVHHHLANFVGFNE
jgi:hypothetical protein